MHAICDVKRCLNMSLRSIVSQSIELRKPLLAALSGLMLALSMPKPGISAFAWVGLAPLLISLRKTRARQAAAYGLIAGAVYYGIILYWLSIFGYLPWALVVLIEAAFIAVFAIVANRMLLAKSGWLIFLAVPATWTAMQWTRCLGAYAFNWGGFAHTQANNVAVIQFASVLGPWGIEFLVCLVNLAVAEVLVCGSGRWRIANIAVSVVLPAVVWVTGWITVPTTKEDANVKAAVIQGNLERGMRDTARNPVRSFNTYARMSLMAAKDHPDLIVWPESALADDITEDRWGYALSMLAKTVDANLVVGGYDPSEDMSVSQSYNGAHFYDRTGRKLGVYRKVHLVPYGEFVPLRNRLSWLERYGIRDEDVLPGKSHTLVKTDIGRVGVSICFESLFPQISRLETKRGAELLVVITNDSWFERTQAARQHMMMSKLRAVENRRWVVRAAATGISAIIDPYGRTIKELEIYKQGIIADRIARHRSLTLYTRFGDWLAYASGISVLLFWLFIRKVDATPTRPSDEHISRTRPQPTSATRAGSPAISRRCSSRK